MKNSEQPSKEDLASCVKALDDQLFALLGRRVLFDVFIHLGSDDNHYFSNCADPELGHERLEEALLGMQINQAIQIKAIEH